MRFLQTLRRRPALLTVALLVFVLAAMVFVPAASAQTYVPYYVQQGDTLAKIASKYCTTWEEIYYLNAGVIGPDPNVLKPGTLLYVPNRCGTSGGGSSVYDHGATMYASGTVTCNVYTVAAGDTWYSIGVRFGQPWENISNANGGGGLYPGRQLIIPGLPCMTPAPPAQKTYISITNPQAGASLPNTFTVSGKGAGLPEGNVVVTAKDSAGRVLAQKATTLQGANVGTGGEGTYSVSLTVNLGNITQGAIEATSPGVQAMAGVSITYSGVSSGSAPPSTGGSGAVYAPGQCTITGLPGAYYYQYPGGPVAGQFVSATKYQAMQRTVYNSMDWYMFETEPGTGNPPVWVSINGLSSISSGCH